MHDVVEESRRIADDVLFPAAADVDARGIVPDSHFDLLAERGFYGLTASEADGGRGLDFEAFCAVFENLAGGCVTTTFTWAQHNGVVTGLSAIGDPSGPEPDTAVRTALRERYLPSLVRGEVRAGVAYAGALPQPPKLWARRTSGGYVLNGYAPFVTGWGIIGLLRLAARDADSAHVDESGQVSGGKVITGLVTPRTGDGLEAEHLTLAAAQGSNTVRLLFTDYFLPDDHVLSEMDHADLVDSLRGSLRLNGYLPLGLAGRCVRLIQRSGAPELAASLDQERGRVGARLTETPLDSEELPGVRAAVAELAMRSASALVITAGSSAILDDHHGQRLLREAAFASVVSSRTGIKTELQHLLASRSS